MIKNSSDTEIPVVLLPPEDGSIKRFLPELRSKFNAKNTFAALKYPNYKLWFWGQMVSLFGSWMQTTALAYFVYELTHSPAFLGYVGFATGIPAWLFTFYGGALADRFSRQKILLTTQIVMMVLSIIIAIMTFTEVITPWYIIILSFMMGIATAFDAPARHAFVNELVEREDLVNAIALNSTMFNTATAVGPAIAGITYALFGPAWCFTINGISFLAVIFNLLRMDLKKNNKPKNNKSVFHEIKEGFKYLKTQKTIISIISITTMLSVFGMSLVTLFPAWAVKILHGDATTNGFLQSARGIGAVLCALILASVSKYIIRGKILVSATIVLPILILVFSFNRSLLISMILLVLIGGVVIVMFNLANGLIQTFVSEEFRGRMMSIYTFSFFALFPVGSLLIGFLAEHFSTPLALVINSSILLLFGIVFYFRYPSLRIEK